MKQKIGGRRLLEWMGTYYLPLQLFCEDDPQEWVVVDASAGTVIASGGSPYEALRGAYSARQKEDDR